MTIETLGIAGGLFSILSFVHFAVDWIFQTHAEAMVKHSNLKVRAKHCLIYTLGFVPILYMLNFNLVKWLIALNVLFWSHIIEDSYVPVFLWAKYIRKPPEFDTIANDKEAFLQFVTTPLGKILMIAIDQIIHLAFLFPIVFMALN